MNNFYLFLGLFLLVDFLLLVFVLYRRARRKFGPHDLQFFRTEWRKISGHEDAKHALMDADKLFHVVMKKKGYQGSVGDQLKKGAKLFSDLNGLWSAHKLRNKIAHELDVRVSSSERQFALRSFEKALKDLGAL